MLFYPYLLILLKMVAHQENIIIPWRATTYPGSPRALVWLG